MLDSAASDKSNGYIPQNLDFNYKNINDLAVLHVSTDVHLVKIKKTI